ncbi:cytochrome P450 [Actinokineospora diospyrosa]|uniref:Cytochrome P450 n=1 Tax=Actinokineospora diospyrosa TaxID=103728 RepID=A0ABT1I834_9PSEU|nr:cytochrome P450 [Actinokineospora diospyrosa]MCP2268772.1 Cytochrome P450 [Actinokineospora diospyrosa]
MGLIRTVGTTVAARLARTALARLVLRKVGTRALSLLPDGALVPLRRDGLEPTAELDGIREQAPITRLPVPFGVNVWLVTGYAENKQVLADTTSFSNDYTHLGELIGIQDQNPGGLGFADPPDHTRLRKLLTPEFTMRRLSRLGPRIDAIVADCLDRMAAATDPVDLVEAFALPIPSLTICELLGVPYADRDEFQRLAVARFDLFGGAGASIGAISESLVYLEGVVKAQRVDPGDGLLGMIIREHGDDVDDKELAGLADGILTGGFETTASMLALGALILLRDQATSDRVREDDAAIGPFVEELLRYLTVVQVAFPRFARRDLEIAGARISAGDVVVCSLNAGNRDDALVGGRPGFDPTRKPTQHLAFGHGAHRCIGAELARMELRAAYPALVRRFPRLRLTNPESSLRFRKTSIVYGVEEIPVSIG